MRSFAEYIMRGRFQAYSIALLGGLVPFLSQATLGLVTLRRGWQEGIIVTLWAMLPPLAELWMNGSNSVFVYSACLVILVSYCSSLVLRHSISWSWTLAFLVIFSSLAGISLSVIQPELADVMQQFFDRLQSEAAEGERLKTKITMLDATGIASFWISYSVFVGLCIARWFQAMLYNPGGFSEEFHNLRLLPALYLLSGLGFVFCQIMGAEYAFWGKTLGLPLLVNGLALAHYVVAKYQKNIAFLVVLYASLIFFGTVSLLLMLIGLTDAWFNYREKLAKQ